MNKGVSASQTGLSPTVEPVPVSPPDGASIPDAAHTPGPWKWQQRGPYWRIIGRPTWPCDTDGRDGEWPVAELDDLMDEFPEEVEANARLIAAAPELLKACQGLLERYLIMGCGEGTEATAAMRAIAKATGAL